MRPVILVVVLCVMATVANAQTPVVVTENDVQIRFPTADDPSWKAPDLITSITHEAAPVGTHIDTMRLGEPATWECEVWGSTATAPRKAVVVIVISSVPSPSDREMECRMRNRYEGGLIPSMWGPPQQVKIIGKPKAPAHTQ